MVADYEIYSAGGRVFYFINGLDTAVEDDYELDVFLGGTVYGRFGDAVSLVVAGGDIEVDFRIEILQITVDQRYGGGAVHVIVAVDKYFLF